MQERIDLLERNLSELKRFFSNHSLSDVLDDVSALLKAVGNIAG